MMHRFLSPFVRTTGAFHSVLEFCLAFILLPCAALQGQEVAGPDKSAKAKPAKSAAEKGADKVKKKAEDNKSAEAKQAESYLAINQGRLKQVADLKGISEDVRKRIAADYQRSIDLIKLGMDWSKRAEQFEKDRAGAPAKIDHLKKETARNNDSVELGNTAKLGLSELEKQAVEAEARLEDAKKLQHKWELEPKKRNDRRVEIGKQRTAAREKLEQIVKEVDAKTQSKDTSEEIRAQRSALMGQKFALEQELECYAKELLFYDASAELPNLEHDVATQEVTRLAKAVKSWRLLEATRRMAEADRAAEKAKAEVANFNDADVDPHLRQLAQDNANLAKNRADMVAEIAGADIEKQKVELQLKQIKDSFEYVKEKVKLGGLSPVNGVYLRQLKEKLPDVRRPRRSLRKLQQTIADVQLRIIELREDREKLADLDDEIDKIATESNIVPEDKLDYQQEVNKLLKTKRDCVNALLADYEKYVEKLSDLDNKSRYLVDQTEKVSAFVHERILWVRSSQPLSGSEAEDTRAAFDWLFNKDNWLGVVNLLKTDAQQHSYLIIAAGLVFIGLSVLRGWLRRRLRAAADIAVRPASTDFAPTMRAVAITSLLAGVGPLPIWFLGWRLVVGLDHTESEFASALADGLFAVALPFLALEFFRQVCRDRGLAEAHFGWKPRVLQLIRGGLRAMVMVGMPIIFMVEIIEATNRSAFTNSLGRMALIGGLGVLAYFAHRLFNPRDGVIKQLVTDAPESLLGRLRWPLYVLVVGLPLCLAVAAGLGYYYTTRHMTLRIKMSVWIGLGSLVSYGLMLRWLLIARRRMAFEQARKRREHQAEVKASENAAGVTELAAQPDLGLDLSTINAQTRRLLRSFMGLTFFMAMWVTWADVVPAGDWLNKITIWNAAVKINETMPSADGPGEIRTVEKIIPITLANLVMSAIIVLMTLAASRNVPGLLEISVLQRLPLDAGGRYAITTVCRYVITIVGTIFAFGAIGIGWSSVQWLAAAMTVGLGFGLQEIFANFISGLILLLERPIRVGDTVTVGEVTGVVTRIRIRATTITDADRKELIVPNKEFITGKLMNWTLSDPTLRVMVRVSVAYGSSPEQVLAILENIGRTNIDVLNDPQPQAFFDGFGENTLNFSLRAFVPSIDSLAKVKHELHIAVDRALRRANIEPTSSHYDIYVRSLPKESDVTADVAGVISGVGRRQSA